MDEDVFPLLILFGTACIIGIIISLFGDSIWKIIEYIM